MSTKQQNPEEPIFSAATRNYALGSLLVVYTFNFVDRQILSILLEAIKLDLALTDTQLGMLTGFAFALFYATLGIPIARWADRGNRVNIISLALLIWSGMTALSGLAQNYWQLLTARIGVGVGEAGCSPPAHSLIADYFPQSNRATALGVYSLGIPVGILFGFLAGGWINEFFGWRVAFFVVGIPGILLAALVRLTLREPVRGMADGITAPVTQPTIGETLRFLSQKKSFKHLAFGGSLTAFVGYGLVTWVPSFLQRSHGMETGEIGTYLGLILGIPGGVGIVLGGYLSDRLGAKNKAWSLWIVSIALLLAVIPTIFVFLVDNQYLALSLLIAPVLLGNFYQATTFSQTQGLVNLRMRAVAAAILLFILNIIGLGLGPQVVGLISDQLHSRFAHDSLRYSLLICSFANVWSAYHYYQAGRYLQEDLDNNPIALTE